MTLQGDFAIASRNPGKIREIQRVCADWLVLWVTADADPRPWPEVEESGATYLENALLKARAVSGALGIPCVADDSGIEVDALGGAPGPGSARFAGEDADDESNIRLLLDSLRHGSVRSARFRCVAVAAWPGGLEVHAEGVCEGAIAAGPCGASGFGYDPVFVPEGEERTMAELAPEEKDAISHRSRAFRALRELVA